MSTPPTFMYHAMKLATLNGLYVFLFIAFFSIQIQAQNNYFIHGKIWDADTKTTLIGATVQVPGTPVAAVSDVNGEYVLENISIKNGRIIVSFIGYETDTILFVFSSERLLEKDIYLKPAATLMKTVEVTALLEGQMKANREQQVASNIKNVVAAEQMVKFPDLNAAESIGRIPGITLQRDQGEGRFVQLRGTPPQLSNFSVNGEQIPSPEGDVRYVGLDVVSIDQLASIEISKALTPDQDGDAIGGSVNLNTKTAKDSIPEIHFSLASGYNQLAGKPLYNLQFAFGQRVRKFGFYLNASHLDDRRASHDMQFNFNESRFGGDTTFQLHYDEVQLRHYDIHRERTGLSGTWDWKFNERNSLYINTLYNRYSDDELRRRVRYDIGSGFILSETSSREAQILRDVKDRQKIQTIANANLGGKHQFGFFTLDYLLSYSLAKEDVPDRMDINFQNDLVNLELDLSEANWPRIKFPREKDSTTVSNSLDYEFDELLLQSSRTEDRNLTARFNLEKNYGRGSLQGSVKLGAKARLKNKERDNQARVWHKYYQLFAVNSPFDSVRQIYTSVGPELSLASVSGGFQETNLLNRNYQLGDTPDPEKSREFFDFYFQNFKLQESDTKEESFSEDYEADEDIYAAYLMATQHWGRAMLLAGLRYERTDINYRGFDVQFREFSDAFERLDTLRSKKSYGFLLPQFHFKYALNDRANLRSALTWTYSRPNFEDILPYRQSELDSRQITLGNPDLRFAKAVNADILAEKYMERGGLLSGGVFYKNIEDFVYYFEQRTFVENISRPGWYFVTTAQNGIWAQVLGAEISWNQQFFKLPGIWQHFGVYFNYTYTWSEATVRRNNKNERIQLPGQSPHAANLALFFDSKKLYAKVSANFNDAFLTELGIKPTWDIYYERNLHLDFNLNYNLTKQFQFYLTAVNLTNTPLKHYLGDSSRVKKQEFYSWWGRIGVRLNI